MQRGRLASGSNHLQEVLVETDEGRFVFDNPVVLRILPKVDRHQFCEGFAQLRELQESCLAALCPVLKPRRDRFCATVPPHVSAAESSVLVVHALHEDMEVGLGDGVRQDAFWHVDVVRGKSGDEIFDSALGFLEFLQGIFIPFRRVLKKIPERERQCGYRSLVDEHRNGEHCPAEEAALLRADKGVSEPKAHFCDCDG